MCGICGIVSNEPRDVRERRVRDMREVLRHRGPDDEGLASDGPCTLGFRRLSIIDLELGRQPMTNEDGAVSVVLNGEIYNYRELRANLRSRHTFRTNSDTEVLVHLYEERGDELVHELRGMFAFAIWDRRNRSLMLARDRLGKKPLAYRFDRGTFAFASEIKALLTDADVPRRVDRTALAHYLSYGYVPAPLSIFEGIRKLPPGHTLRFQEGRVAVRRYWTPTPRTPTSPDEIQEAIEEAVRHRMISDVPIGAFLSGGIDSSIVVGLMARQGPVRAFSIGFQDKSFDELPYARAVAKAAGAEHEEFQVRPDAMEVLPRLAWHFDEPFADSSAVPTWYLSKMTATRVKVALSGDGGDEDFGGYARYRVMRYLGVPAVVGRLLAPLMPATSRRLQKASRVLNLLDRPASEVYRSMILCFTDAQRSEIGVGDIDTSALITFGKNQKDAVNAATLSDLMTYLPYDLLTKVDAASMAHGLEVRCPFLDHRVVELALGIPGEQKVSMRGGKVILKRLFRDLLPVRRGKQGFAIPLASWLRRDLATMVQDALLKPKSNQFEAAPVRRMVEEHQSGRVDHAERLWALLMFELWYRAFRV